MEASLLPCMSPEVRCCFAANNRRKTRFSPGGSLLSRYYRLLVRKQRNAQLFLALQQTFRFPASGEGRRSYIPEETTDEPLISHLLKTGDADLDMRSRIMLSECQRRLGDLAGIWCQITYPCISGFSVVTVAKRPCTVSMGASNFLRVLGSYYCNLMLIGIYEALGTCIVPSNRNPDFNLSDGQHLTT